MPITVPATLTAFAMANYPNLIHIRKWNIRSVTKAYHSSDSTYVSNFISDVMEPVHFIENLPPRDIKPPFHGAWTRATQSSSHSASRLRGIFSKPLPPYDQFFFLIHRLVIRLRKRRNQNAAQSSNHVSFSRRCTADSNRCSGPAALSGTGYQG